MRPDFGCAVVKGSEGNLQIENPEPDDIEGDSDLHETVFKSGFRNPHMRPAENKGAQK